MKLHEAIAYAIEREGEDIITRPLLVNYLADLQAYDTPAVKRIVKTIVDEGHGKRLLSSIKAADYALQIADIELRMVRNEGFQQSLVHNVLTSVSQALGKACDQPTLPTESEQCELQVCDKEQAADCNEKPYNPKNDLPHYQYPSLDLLDKRDVDGKPYMDESVIEIQKDRIIDVFSSYDIDISDIKTTIGPTITYYEITPAHGVKMSKVRKYEEDISYSLYSEGLRILAPIPGKGTIGIEMPNDKDNIITLGSILRSESFKETTMDLPCAIGKTMNDEIFMFDLTSMPHILVTGGIGQGKSIGLSTIISSLLYKKHPSEIKFVLIDPKGVEFSMFEIVANHFLARVEDEIQNVITDVKQAVRTLCSLCIEMETRYDLLKKAAVRNIKEYNNKFVSRQLNPAEGHMYMPYIVAVIDDFDILMSNADKQLEQPIVQLAHLAHIVGIHLIIATQHPTKAIITESILNNFPGRIAFKTSTPADSKRIIDCIDAFKLKGRGDMLFLKGSIPMRGQCAFVDMKEIERICNFISKQESYIFPYELSDEEKEISKDEESKSKYLDPLIEDAARLVVTTFSGSTSMLQRQYSIGYSRAGQIMEQLEKLGIVGPAKGGRPRDILIFDPKTAENIIRNFNHR